MGVSFKRAQTFIKGNLKILCPTKTIDLMGKFKGASPPKTKMGVFIILRLILRVGGENMEK